MKTLKISDLTHLQLTELQSYLYKKEGIKYTFDQLIKNMALATALKLVEKHDK